MLHEHGINLTLYVSPLGKVTQVDFLIRKSDKVTATELEQLENSIKTNVAFKLSPGDTKGGHFFRVSLFVKYQNVLDGIER
jgi:hypothetical protein